VVTVIKSSSINFTYLKEMAIKIYHDNNSILDECSLMNIRRAYYLSMISVPLRLVNILLFLIADSYDTHVANVWRKGIITSHFSLLAFMLGLFLLTRKLRYKKEANTFIHIIQYIVVIVIMASGVAIVTIDQLVTSNITPFLLICIVCGIVFLIRPLVSFVMFTATYASYYFLLELTISNQEMLLSNRVNGITAVGIGFLISLIMWNNNYTNIFQKRRIAIQQKQLERMAYYDPLTDLPNRRMLSKLLKQEISLMKKSNSHESIIIILDIDDFKNINDTYGHPVGDNMIIQLGNLLKSNVRELDTVSRFGGEEYIILMPRTSLENGYNFAERLRKLISEKEFTIGSISLRITCSFGISLLSNNIENSDDYYFLADKALYLAKQNGKNRVEIVYDNVM
jgi:diguanylate cyclase (GGDEF)-like protein